MYSARDRVEFEAELEELAAAADRLELSEEARSVAADLFLSGIPEQDRSKSAVIAASLYAGALITGEERSQTAVAEAVGVSRLVINDRWKPLLEDAGFEPPAW
ncbi:MAG: transcription initiation factor IIB family protein [Halobacteriales archaeon]|nr:transcription initiation factor IIB family protein [Halobacteriales archaeon]